MIPAHFGLIGCLFKARLLAVLETGSPMKKEGNLFTFLELID
jgi:hypothetical protein